MIRIMKRTALASFLAVGILALGTIQSKAEGPSYGGHNGYGGGYNSYRGSYRGYRGFGGFGGYWGGFGGYGSGFGCTLLPFAGTLVASVGTTASVTTAATAATADMMEAIVEAMTGTAAPTATAARTLHLTRLSSIVFRQEFKGLRDTAPEHPARSGALFRNSFATASQPCRNAGNQPAVGLSCPPRTKVIRATRQRLRRDGHDGT